MLSDDYLRQVAAFLEGAGAELRDRPRRRQPAWMAMLCDLLAECRALRRPPDGSGLMPAADLAEMRTWTSLGGKWLGLLFGHIDAQAALIRDLYGVVADLHADDPGRQALLERGRAEGREMVLGVLRKFFGAPDPAEYPALAEAFEVARALGPARPPLPPQEAEREAERLREALRPLLAFCDYCQGGDHWRGRPVAPLDATHLDAARAALGEPLT